MSGERRERGPEVATLLDRQANRRLATWPQLEIRQAGRGILVRVATPWFAGWWHDRHAWEGSPLAEVYDWLAEERES